MLPFGDKHVGLFSKLGKRFLSEAQNLISAFAPALTTYLCAGSMYYLTMASSARNLSSQLACHHLLRISIRALLEEIMTPPCLFKPPGTQLWSMRCRLEVQGKRELAFFPGLAKGAVYPGFTYQSEAGTVAAPISFKVMVRSSWPKLSMHIILAVTLSLPHSGSGRVIVVAFNPP